MKYTSVIPLLAVRDMWWSLTATMPSCTSGFALAPNGLLSIVKVKVTEGCVAVVRGGTTMSGRVTSMSENLPSTKGAQPVSSTTRPRRRRRLMFRSLPT
jgi:hypothetical protein